MVNQSAMIITKGVDDWPTDSKQQIQKGTIDLWWIIDDGGLLLLIAILLKKHKIWEKCKLRIFTTTTDEENFLHIKNNLIKYIYHLRIDAEVDLIEMNNSEVSAYSFERFIQLKKKEDQLKKMNLDYIEDNSKSENKINEINNNHSSEKLFKCFLIFKII